MKTLLKAIAVLFIGGVVLSTVKASQRATAASTTAAPAANPDDETPATRKAKVTIATNADCKGADARAQRIAKSHPDWKPEGVALVACHEFAVGMTADMLRASLGKPEVINTTETAAGTHEQWVYGRDYIYVEGGVVTSLQTSR